MELRRVPISEVVPWDKNPRGILKKDFERLKRQIKRLGVYKPLVVCEDGGKKGKRRLVVLGGNMRLLALRELGIKEVEVSVVKAPTDKERIEYSLSDNDRAGYYEEERLAELIYPYLEEINLEDFKIDLGKLVDLKDVVERFGPDIDDGADEVPDVDDTPAVTKLGDLFTLGRHRVMCGDSTKAEDVARLMRGENIDLVLTGPPYGIGVEYGVFNDSPENVRNLITRIMPMLLKYPVVLLTPGITEMWSYPRPRWLLGWVHPAGMGACAWGFTSIHPILAYGDDPYLKRGLGGRPTAIVLAAGREGQAGHPTPKPIAVWEWLMERASPTKGESVYDPFLGSGTTLIAAEKLNRICYGMEIDPKYCDVIIKRYADYVGIPEKKIRATREKA